jgi:carboxymethylenebutenolidase
MKHITLILICLLTQATLAQDWARARLEKSPRHREWVTVKHDGRAIETFVVQDLADQLAEAGYIAVAPDLLPGLGTNGGRPNFPQDKAVEAVSHLNPDQITGDLNAVADYALKLPASSGRPFVAGFCWGGGQTFRFETNRTDLAGAFVFYGRLDRTRP